MHVLGPEGVDGNGGHQRRVDPAGEADDHVGEGILADVVAGTHDQRPVYLGFGSTAAPPGGGQARHVRALAGLGSDLRHR